MKKKFIFLIYIFITALTLYTAYEVYIYINFDKNKLNIQSESGIINIVVLPFECLTDKQDIEGKYISDEIENKLSFNSKINLLNRDNIKDFNKELELKKILGNKISKNLIAIGADFILTGKYEIDGESITIIPLIIDTRKADRYEIDRLYCKKMDIDNLINKLSENYQASLNILQKDANRDYYKNKKYSFDNKVIAIIDFGSTESSIGKGFTNLLTNDMLSISRFKIVNRKKINSVLKEYNISLSGFTNFKSIQRIGKLLTADVILTGNIIEQKDKIKINIKFVEVERGNVLYTDSISGQKKNIILLEKKLVNNFIKKMNFILTPALEKKINRIPTSIFEAFLNYSEGMELFYRDDINKAAESFTKAVYLDPKYIEAEYMLGKSAECKSEYRNAIELYNKTFSQNPKSYIADKILFSVSECYYKLNEYDAAVDKLLYILKNYPNTSFRTEIFYKLGNIYEQLGKYTESYEYYRKVLMPYPFGYFSNIDNEIHQKLIKLSKLKKDVSYWDKLISKFKERIEINDNDYEAHYLLGYYSHRQKGDNETALREFKKAIKLRPDFADAHRELGLVYFKLNKPDLLLEETLKFNKLFPFSVMGYNNLGNYYFTLGDYNNAKKYYIRGLELDGKTNNMIVLWMSKALGDIYINERNSKKAKEYFRLGSNIFHYIGYERFDIQNLNDNLYCRERLAELEYADSNFDTSIFLYKSIIELSPQSNNTEKAWNSLFQIYKNIDKLEEYNIYRKNFQLSNEFFSKSAAAFKDSDWNSAIKYCIESIRQLPTGFLAEERFKALKKYYLKSGSIKKYTDYLISLKNEYSNETGFVNAVNNELNREEYKKTFVKKWMVLGPFDNFNFEGFNKEYINTEKIELQRSYIGKYRENIVWMRLESEKEDGFVDFNPIFDFEYNALAYAYTSVYSPEKRKVIMNIGSDDSFHLFINGKLIYKHLISSSGGVDRDKVKYTLNKGWNTILIKICESYGGWGFYFRITDTNNRHIEDLMFSLEQIK